MLETDLLRCGMSNSGKGISEGSQKYRDFYAVRSASRFIYLCRTEADVVDYCSHRQWQKSWGKINPVWKA